MWQTALNTLTAGYLNQDEHLDGDSIFTDGFKGIAVSKPQSRTVIFNLHIKRNSFDK